MYLEFFRLKMKPFELTVDPQFIFYSEHHREALASLVYGIREGKGFIVLTGEVGTGKTTLLNALLNILRRSDVQTGYLFNSTISKSDFYRYLLADFGLSPVGRTKAGTLITLYRWLLDRHRAGQQTVLIIDEAQNLSRELMEEIRLLTNFETADGKLLQIVLSGQPELEHRLKDASLRQLRQRISLRYTLPPLNVREVELYIARRLRVAGLSEQNIFPLHTLADVYMYSQGIPRLINTLCDHAMVLAYARGQSCVSPGIIRDVAEQFDLAPLAEHGRLPELEFASPRSEPDRVSSEFAEEEAEFQEDPFVFLERQFEQRKH